IKAWKISGLLDKQRGLLRRQAGEHGHGEEEALIVVLEELLLVQDLGRLQGGGDLEDKVADDLIAGLPSQQEALVARQPRMVSGLFVFVQDAIFCVAVSSLEIGTQFIEVETDVVAGRFSARTAPFGSRIFPWIAGMPPARKDWLIWGVLVAFGDNDWTYHSTSSNKHNP